MAEPACSFCGATAPGLIEGDGARICEECVVGSYEALRTERRLGEARESSAPPPEPPAESRSKFGTISDWAAFSIEGVDLEWRAERTLATSRLPIVLVMVRRPGAERMVLMELEGHEEPQTEHVREAVSWLTDGKLSQLRDWTPISVENEAYEWRAHRGMGVRARPAVWVHVRNAKTGVGTMMELDGDAEPTVDDAAMAVADAEDVLSG